MRVLVAALFSLCVAGAGPAQQPPAPSFDAVSIKVNRSGEQGGSSRGQPGRYVGVNVTLTCLLSGSFVFTLYSSMTISFAHVSSLVRVMSRDRHQVYLTAFTNIVARPHDLKHVITFGEAPRNVAPPIKLWYPVSGGDGREFIYT